jgi:hypothetical protein
MTYSGEIIISDVESDRTVTLPTKQCCHCGSHWVAKADRIAAEYVDQSTARDLQAAGKTMRGFCTRCSGPVCGPDCAGQCIPQEQMLEAMEGTVDLSRGTVSVSRGGVLIPG